MIVQPEDRDVATRVLTLVICTANRARDLAFTLQAMRRLRRPAGWTVQLIVVDNGSTDDTPAVLAAAAPDLPFDLEVVQGAKPGLAAARNAGMAQARGDIIAWTDDDCIPPEDWLEKLVRHFEQDPALDVLGGQVRLFNPSHYPMTVKLDTMPKVMEAQQFPGDFLLGCNMAFRRSVPARIGAFDDRFGAGAPLRAAEDTDFLHRALTNGCRIAYQPDVLLYHNHGRVTHDQVMRLRRSYNYADGAFLMKCLLAGERMAPRWMYWRLAALFARVLRPPAWLTARRDNTRLLLDFLVGAAAFTRCAMSSSASRSCRPDRMA